MYWKAYFYVYTPNSYTSLELAKLFNLFHMKNFSLAKCKIKFHSDTFYDFLYMLCFSLALKFKLKL